MCRPTVTYSSSNDGGATGQLLCNPAPQLSSVTVPNHHSNEHERNSKTVSFSMRARVLIIPSTDDYTEEERSNTWRTEEDKRTSQTETVNTIKLCRRYNGQVPLKYGDSVSIRGLESLCSKEAALSLKNHRDNYISAVLNEQDYQWANTHAPPCYETESQALRAVAIQNSKAASRQAMSLAAQDAAYVRRQQKLDDRRQNGSI